MKKGPLESYDSASIPVGLCCPIAPSNARQTNKTRIAYTLVRQVDELEPSSPGGQQVVQRRELCQWIDTSQCPHAWQISTTKSVAWSPEMCEWLLDRFNVSAVINHAICGWKRIRGRGHSLGSSAYQGHHLIISSWITNASEANKERHESPLTLIICQQIYKNIIPLKAIAFIRQHHPEEKMPERFFTPKNSLLRAEPHI